MIVSWVEGGERLWRATLEGRRGYLRLESGDLSFFKFASFLEVHCGVSVSDRRLHPGVGHDVVNGLWMSGE
ncbi:MAG: hypothetical protein HC933_04850 [Pleurocapsa sp. SU_196_0]|nr:hypothetical protein [Pleurocapsa sp. SU_196_0]